MPTTGAAAIMGAEPKTWSAYVARGQAPAPEDHAGREPVWHLSTVRHDIDPPRPARPPAEALTLSDNKQTLRFLGERIVVVEAVEGSPFEVGTVTFTGATTQRAVVDASKQVPGMLG
ncbi:hypothetical protein [Streptomyces sp. AHA2]|uniref:hypothetical protein n=1 Tax=Streptomyces sp. AHA2 TaxID=3064526 RepID=UPI002FDF0A84